MKCIINNQVVLSRPPEGPLTAQIGSFAISVREQGYSRVSIHRQVLLAACFSRWLNHLVQLATNIAIRQCIPRPKEERIRPDVFAVLDTLQQEARQPGSVAVRVGRHKRTVILVGQDLFAEPHSQKELKLT